MNEGASDPSCSPLEGPGSEPLEWHFLQCFGERTPGEEIQDGACFLVSQRLTNQRQSLALSSIRMYIQDGSSHLAMGNHLGARLLYS